MMLYCMRKVNHVKRQTEGISEKLLECAEKEFLSKGFNDASLRDIAGNAGVSTSTIYTRFGDKLGLLRAIIAPVADELKAMYVSGINSFFSQQVDAQKATMQAMATVGQRGMVDFIYDNIAVFRLLMIMPVEAMRSEIIDAFSRINVQSTTRYIEAIGSDAFTAGRMTPTLLYTISTAFFAGVMETVKQDMTREQAYRHLALLQNFFRTGWAGVF